MKYKINGDIRDTVQLVYQNKKAILDKLIENKSKEDLLEIANELNCWEWNCDKLGKFVSPEIAVTLHYYLLLKCGAYECLKYYHLEMKKSDPHFCKTEEEFKEFILSELYNQSQFNPLQGL